MNNGNQPSVFGAGLLALDIVLSRYTEQAPRSWAGGTCGNVLAILSYLGWCAFPIARLNGDIASDRIREDLKQWGVQLDFVSLSPTGDAPVIIQKNSINKQGHVSHKWLFTCPRCGNWLPRYKPVHSGSAQIVAQEIKDPQVFFMDRLSRGAIILAKACAEKGALVVFEPSGNSDPKLFREALDISHVLKYAHDRRSELDFNPNGISKSLLLEIETLGHEGLRFRRSSQTGTPDCWHHIKSYNVDDIRDTAGAGDWCTAGLIHLLGRMGVDNFSEVGLDQIINALTFGQSLAAWNCQYEGARGGMYKVEKDTFWRQVEQIRSGSSLGFESVGQQNICHDDVINNICLICRDQ